MTAFFALAFGVAAIIGILAYVIHKLGTPDEYEE
jgi:hypothetical protein